MCLFIFLASSFPLKQKFSEFKQFDHSPASLSLASLDLRLQRLQARPAVIAAVTQRPRLLLSSLELTASHWPPRLISLHQSQSPGCSRHLNCQDVRDI